MNVWPVELYSYVFELACTDDGRTARALSLTSKQIREISRRYLYQSLVLTRLAQLTALLEKWENVPCHLRRIKHLFLALKHSDSTTGSLESTCPLETPLVIKVLSLTAPTLESLSFAPACLLTGTSLLSTLFRIPFPFLTELSLAGLYPFSFQFDNFPNLRYLHFAEGNRNPCGLLKFGALDRAFPKLTHLRVSGLSRARTFIDELECALDQSARRCRRPQPSEVKFEPEPETWSAIQHEIINLPSRLEMIYVQTKASTSPAISRASSRRSSSSHLTKMNTTIKDDDVVLRPTINVLMSADTRQQSMMNRLTRLEEQFGATNTGSRGRGDRDVSVHLTVVNACEQQGDAVLGLLHDWLDRLDGRDGPWV